MGRIWIALDAIGHKIPLLRFGRLRYAICLKAVPAIERAGE